MTVIVIILLFIFSLIIVYPVTLFPAFQILEGKLLLCDIMKDIWQKYIRSVIVIVTIIVGILSIGSFANMLALVGSGICTPIGLVLPSLFHFLIFKSKQSYLRSIIDLTVSLIGVILIIVIALFTILNW
jgi:hypothetical protein